jgi:ABC-type nickel/cobalt efflux system permease component RcnA
MPLSSLITGVIAAVYTAKDGEINLERVAAMLAALVAAWVLFKRAARRYWQRAHPDAPASAFPLDR